jgi:hypothetical protein
MAAETGAAPKVGVPYRIVHAEAHGKETVETIIPTYVATTDRGWYVEFRYPREDSPQFRRVIEVPGSDGGEA